MFKYDKIIENSIFQTKNALKSYKTLLATKYIEIIITKIYYQFINLILLRYLKEISIHFNHKIF